MNQSPDNFDFEPNGFQLPDSYTDQQQAQDQYETENLVKENIIARKKQLGRLLLILLAFGLCLGLLLSVGVVILLNKLGLTKKPYEIEQQQQQPTEIIKLLPMDNL